VTSIQRRRARAFHKVSDELRDGHPRHARARLGRIGEIRLLRRPRRLRIRGRGGRRGRLRRCRDDWPGGCSGHAAHIFAAGATLELCPADYRLDLNWRQGDKIPLTAERTLRVLGVRDDDADQPPALIVEDLPGSATSAAR
jgi:hypothetical protein